MDIKLIKAAWECKCPRCQTGSLYKPGFLNLSLKDKCDDCGLDYRESDSADGPAVFLIFILGFTLVPLALWVEFTFTPPLWLHAILWGVLALVLTLGSLRPLTAYVMGLQWKYRATSWEDTDHDG